MNEKIEKINQNYQSITIKINPKKIKFTFD